MEGLEQERVERARKDLEGQGKDRKGVEMIRRNRKGGRGTERAEKRWDGMETHSRRLVQCFGKWNVSVLKVLKDKTSTVFTLSLYFINVFVTL